MHLAEQRVFLSDKHRTKTLSKWIFAPAAFLIVITASAFAANQDMLIPNWFLNVYQYYTNHQISEKEFENAIVYLQKIGAMKLVEKPQSDPITNFVTTHSIIEQGNSEFSDCSPDWYITGYFTPIESDYAGKFITISIDGASYKFREDFVAEIKTQGWGRTLLGNYLGWYDDSYHLSDFALDGTGNKLELYSVAVDPDIIPTNSRITIPTLLEPWNNVVFLASDVGTAIIGKHIDVYTGEGKKAFDEAYRITGYDNTVCLEAK